MKHRLVGTRHVVAILVVSAFVLLAMSALLIPVQAGKPGGGLTAAISPRSFTTYFGCKPRGCTAFVQFTFTASGGTQPYTYSWNWGDGTGGGPLSGQTGSVIETHTYISLVAKYTVTFTAVDASGLGSTATATVFVKLAH